jgi:hypothetical protein
LEITAVQALAIGLNVLVADTHAVYCPARAERMHAQNQRRA